MRHLCGLFFLCGVFLGGCAFTSSDDAQANSKTDSHPNPAPAPLASQQPYRLMTCDELKLRLANGSDWVVLDVRSPGGYRQEHLPTAINIPYGQLDLRYQELPKDRAIVLYCA